MLGKSSMTVRWFTFSRMIGLLGIMLGFGDDVVSLSQDVPISDAHDEEYGVPVISTLEKAELQYEEDEEERQHLEDLERYIITSEQMSVRNYPTQSFLIGPNILPKNGRMLLTAENGTGKSAIVLHIAACLATEQPLFGLVSNKHDATFGRPVFPTFGKSSVLYVDYEIPEHIRESKRLQPLRKTFKENFGPNIAFVKKPSDYRLENMRGEANGNGSFDRLLTLVMKVKPNVLILDPFSSTHSPHHCKTYEIATSCHDVWRARTPAASLKLPVQLLQ
jgi:hypothetical protein